MTTWSAGSPDARAGELRPHFDIGLDTRRLVERLDLLSGLDERQLDRVAELLRPRFTVPDERIIREGDRADACFFIASGAVEVRQPGRHIRLGSGEFFGELALLTGRRRQADVVALTYCQLLVLRRADFQRFLSAHPDAQATINRVAAGASGDEPERDRHRRSAAQGSLEQRPIGGNRAGLSDLDLAAKLNDAARRQAVVFHRRARDSRTNAENSASRQRDIPGLAAWINICRPRT